MKAVLVNPKDIKEFKFVTDLLNKLGIEAISINPEEMEDRGMSGLLKKSEKGKKANKAEIMRKLRS